MVSLRFAAFRLFDINKFMNKEQIVGVSSLPDLQDLQKIKRKSLQHTARVADYKNNIILAQNITKSTINTQPNRSSVVQPLKATRVWCTLPSKKQYMIKIVVDPPKIKIKNKNEGKQAKKTKIASNLKPVQKKDQQTEDNLLAKFLVACKQLQNDDKIASKEVVETCKKSSQCQQSLKPSRRTHSLEPQQKWVRFSAKFKQLTARLNSIEQTLISLN